MDDSATDGDCYRLSPIDGAWLAHDVPETNLDGFLCDEQPVSDLPIPVALGDLPKNSHFPFAESFVAEMFRKSGSNLRRDTLSVRVDLASSLWQGALPRSRYRAIPNPGDSLHTAKYYHHRLSRTGTHPAGEFMVKISEQRRCRTFHRVGILWICSVLVAPAQIHTGSLTGAVLDPTCASVADEDRSPRHSVRSDRLRQYLLRSLSPGRYTVEFVAAGFESLDLHDFVIERSASLSAAARSGLAGFNLLEQLQAAETGNLNQSFANSQVAVRPAPYSGDAPLKLPNARIPGTDNLSAARAKQPWQVRIGLKLYS